jgi:hypothetical protein
MFHNHRPVPKTPGKLDIYDDFHGVRRNRETNAYLLPKVFVHPKFGFGSRVDALHVEKEVWKISLVFANGRSGWFLTHRRRREDDGTRRPILKAVPSEGFSEQKLGATKKRARYVSPSERRAMAEED